MADRAPTVGLNNAFMVNTYYPLYSEFFRRLGFRVALPDQALQEGIERKRAPFCYPAEAAHGYFAALLDEKPDFLFLPHVQGVSAGPETDPSTVCPLSQGEPYYLSTSFKDHPHLAKLRKGTTGFKAGSGLFPRHRIGIRGNDRSGCRLGADPERGA
jgi:predicted nucleotide-binding protein (sugar kinase/HSP70/actin superfamily)